MSMLGKLQQESDLADEFSFDCITKLEPAREKVDDGSRGQHLG